MFRGLSAAPATVLAEAGQPVPPARPPRVFRARVSRGRLVTLVALTVMGGFLALQVGREVHANFTITQRAADLRLEIAEVEAENRELARQLDYLRSDAYISQEARRLLNLGSADERVLIIPPGAEASLPVPLGTTPPERPMLQQWMQLFFGD